MKMNDNNNRHKLLVVFDYDGVLADSKRAYARQMQETVKIMTGKEIPLIEFTKRVGNSDQLDDFTYFINSSDKQTVNRAAKIYSDLTPKYQNERKLFPETTAVLEAISKLCYIGVVSRKSQKRLDFWLDLFNINGYIDMAIGTLEYSKAPAINKIRTDLGISKNKTLMVGDTAFDIMSAKEAGVKSVAALYDTLMKEEMLNLKPDYVIKSLNELVTIVKKELTDN